MASSYLLGLEEKGYGETNITDTSARTCLVSSEYIGERQGNIDWYESDN